MTVVNYAVFIPLNIHRFTFYKKILIGKCTFLPVEIIKLDAKGFFGNTIYLVLTVRTFDFTSEQIFCMNSRIRKRPYKDTPRYKS